ncbi:MAG: hypothetical protein KatS3mg058_2661 [Roseiflexus sp.]|nr:MAG: hypothetical protein KatS3mg058_2661 [Roseiflexus sp.]
MHHFPQSGVKVNCGDKDVVGVPYFVGEPAQHALAADAAPLRSGGRLEFGVSPHQETPHTAERLYFVTRSLSTSDINCLLIWQSLLDASASML